MQGRFGKGEKKCRPASLSYPGRYTCFRAFACFPSPVGITTTRP